jgi:hypothetical protein
MFLKDMLPQGNVVPEIIYEVKRIICLLGLGVKIIHACKNDENYNRNKRKDGPKRCFGTFLYFLV